MCTITEKLSEYPKRHGKSIEVLADELGYESPSTLARHLNPNDHARPFPLKKLIPLIRACNNDFTALDHIENALSRVAFSTPKQSEEITLKSIGQLAEKSGAAMASMAEALEDGHIDEDERKALTRAMIALSQQVNTILSKLQ